MRRLYIRLSNTEAEQLIRLAREERRRPADQAGLMLEDAIRSRADRAPTPERPPEQGRLPIAASA